MDITYEDIKFFITAVETQSYSKAALVLSTTRTTVSRKITRLEQLLGAKLILVNTYSFKVTDFGLQFYDSVVDSVLKFDSSMQEIKSKFQVQQEPEGVLRVLLPPILSMYYISPKIPEFVMKYPKLELVIFYSKDFETDPVKHELDLMLINHLPSKQDQKVKKVFSVEYGFFCTKKYQEEYGIPETLDELDEHVIMGHAQENYKLEHSIAIVNSKTGVSSYISMPKRLMSNSENNSLCFLKSNKVIIALMMKNDICLEQLDLVRVLPDYYFKEYVNYYIVKNSLNNNPNVNLFISFIEERSNV